MSWSDHIQNSSSFLTIFRVDSLPCPDREYEGRWSGVTDSDAVVRLTSNKETIGEVRLARRSDSVGGVRTEEWSASEGTINGGEANLVLRRSIDPQYEIAVRHCPGDAGFVGGQVVLVFRPLERADVDAWLKQHAYGAKLKNPHGEEKQNIYTLDVPYGAEDGVVEDLLRQPWTLDAARVAQESGPDAYFVRFAAASVFKDIGDQQALREKLIAILKQQFALTGVNDQNVTVYGQGLSYKFALNAPVDRLGNHQFAGYWLKTDVMLRFTRQVENGRMLDELEVDIPDGYLARWPSSGEAPPDGHFDHLSPDGETRYRNFTILEWLQSAISNNIGKQWHGEVIGH